MATSATTSARTATGTDLVAAVLLATGAAALVTGAWSFLAPGSFYDVIATYAPRNDHFLRDIGTFNVALGVAAVYGARRPSWRAPMLGVLAVQYGLHMISHLIDIGEADPRGVGVATFVVLLVVTIALAALFAREHRA